jgi:hypothetical protein
VTLCPKCVIGGVLQNGGMLNFDEADDLSVSGFRVEFQFSLATDDAESAGTRDVAFDGDLVEGTLIDGLLRGTLSGQWDVLTDKREGRVEASLETYSRRGLLALLVLRAEDESGRTFFSANLRPTRMSIDPKISLKEMRGTVFLSWDDPARANEFAD